MEDLHLVGGSAYMMPFPYRDGFDLLKAQTRWMQTHQNMYGKVVATPRLTAWYGDPGCSYQYSSIKNEPEPWNDLLLDIRSRVEDMLKFTFNSVLLNYYRSGRDSIGFHADDERELGPEPVIASLSFGCTRPFIFRHKRLEHPDVVVELEDQTLLLMMGETQKNWKHGIEKSRIDGERINLTFRRIFQ